MKKIFSLLAAMLCVWSAAWAETATFGAGTFKSSQKTYKDASGIVTLDFSMSGDWFGGGNQTMKVSVADGYLVKTVTIDAEKEGFNIVINSSEGSQREIYYNQTGAAYFDQLNGPLSEVTFSSPQIVNVSAVVVTYEKEPVDYGGTKDIVFSQNNAYSCKNGALSVDLSYPIYNYRAMFGENEGCTVKVTDGYCITGIEFNPVFPSGTFSSSHGSLYSYNNQVSISINESAKAQSVDISYTGETNYISSMQVTYTRVPVARIDDNNYYSLEGAIAAATGELTNINIASNIVSDKSFDITTNVQIYLNGYSIKSNVNNCVFHVNENAELNVYGSGVIANSCESVPAEDADKRCVFYNEGNLEIEAANVINATPLNATPLNATPLNATPLNGANAVPAKPQNLGRGLCLISCTSDVSAIYNKGYLYLGSGVAVNNTAGKVLLSNGGEMEIDNAMSLSGAVGVVAENGAEVKISASSINIAADGYAFSADNSSIINAYDVYCFANNVLNSSENVKVHSGYFTNGNFTPANGANIIELPEDNVIDGLKYRVITPAAKIGDVEYASLKEAYAAAQGKVTITILSDNDAFFSWVSSASDNDITIDLNGHTLFATFRIINGKFTITDSSEAMSGIIRSYPDYYGIYLSNGELIVKRAVFSAGIGIRENGKASLYDIVMSKGTLLDIGDNAEVTLYGGMYNLINIEDNPTVKIAEGYAYVDNSGENNNVSGIITGSLSYAGKVVSLNPTAINSISAKPHKTIKTVKDGKIVIIRDGQMYNLNGSRF